MKNDKDNRLIYAIIAISVLILGFASIKGFQWFSEMASSNRNNQASSSSGSSDTPSDCEKEDRFGNISTDSICLAKQEFISDMKDLESKIEELENEKSELEEEKSELEDEKENLENEKAELEDENQEMKDFMITEFDYEW